MRCSFLSMEDVMRSGSRKQEGMAPSNEQTLLGGRKAGLETNMLSFLRVWLKKADLPCPSLAQAPRHIHCEPNT